MSYVAALTRVRDKVIGGMVWRVLNMSQKSFYVMVTGVMGSKKWMLNQLEWRRSDATWQELQWLIRTDLCVTVWRRPPLQCTQSPVSLYWYVCFLFNEEPRDRERVRCCTLLDLLTVSLPSMTCSLITIVTKNEVKDPVQTTTIPWRQLGTSKESSRMVRSLRSHVVKTCQSFADSVVIRCWGYWGH